MVKMGSVHGSENMMEKCKRKKRDILDRLGWEILKGD